LSAIGAGFTGFFPVVGNISLNINTVQNLTVIDYANTSFTLDPNTNKWSIDMQVPNAEVPQTQFNSFYFLLGLAI